MKDDLPGALIEIALKDYDLCVPCVERLKSSDHINSRIVTNDGTYFLKILASNATESQLRSRQHFADFLRAGDLNIPKPILSRNGRPFVRVGPDRRPAILTPWIEAMPREDPNEQICVEQYGNLLAHFHCRSQEYRPPQNLEFPSWKGLYIPTVGSWLSRFLETAALDRDSKLLLNRAVAQTCTIESKFPQTRENFGLIHADFHQDNLIFDGQEIWILDLEDIGWGHFLFDLTWPVMLAAKHHPDNGEFRTAFIRGYQKKRRLTSQECELIPVFLLAAGLGALEMVDSSPIPNGSPVAKEWLLVITKWFREHLLS